MLMMDSMIFTVFCSSFPCTNFMSSFRMSSFMSLREFRFE